MGMPAILFNWAEPFEQIINVLTEGPIWYLVEIAQAVSEKTLKNYTINPGARIDNPKGDKILIVIKIF